MLTYGHMYGPQGFYGSGEKGYLFSGSWGALVNIFREQTHGFWDLGSPVKSKKVKDKFLNLTLEEMPPLCLIKNIGLLGGGGGG